MVTVLSIASLVLKIFKLVVNLIVVILYRTGYGGGFLGVGGTWNLNEEKSADAEIVASGVIVGYFIYTAVCLMAYCFGYTKHKQSLVEIMMNFVGTIMWISVGGTALHYWSGYMKEQHYTTNVPERSVGLAVGALCVIEGAAYLIDTVLSFMHFASADSD